MRRNCAFLQYAKSFICRIFKYFDADNDGFINREEWVLGLSVFLKGNYNSISSISNIFDLWSFRITFEHNFRIWFVTSLNDSLFNEGNDEEHIGYCFDIYDLNGDGMISREEMLTMLKTSLGRQGLDEDPDEGVKVGFLFLHYYFTSYIAWKFMESTKKGRTVFSQFEPTNYFLTRGCN